MFVQSASRPIKSVLLFCLCVVLGQASYNYSIQPHGVFFNKSNEGALYQDYTSGPQKADDMVQPGQIYTYRWTVPEEVGPTSADVQCITWLYYSSVDPVKDTNSGERAQYRSVKQHDLPTLLSKRAIFLTKWRKIQNLKRFMF